MAAITATAIATYGNSTLGWNRLRPSHSFTALSHEQSSSTAAAVRVSCPRASTEHAGVFTADKPDFDYLGQSTRGDLDLNFEFDDEGAGLDGPIEDVARMEAQEAEHLLNHLGIPDPLSSRYSPRGIFCSRTLNLRSISAIGYDMDYTLMHYNVEAWEGRAYDYCLENLKNMGFPVGGLTFDPELVIRGLVIDKEKGNLVKADRFGYVKRAMHVSEIYGRELVDLRKESRWEFLNTLFSVSEAVAYMQVGCTLEEVLRWLRTHLAFMEMKFCMLVIIHIWMLANLKSIFGGIRHSFAVN